MSGKTTNTAQWLESHHSGYTQEYSKKTTKIAIASGKGGVGKTTTALKFAKLMADGGKKVLLVDCDYNLSNTALKLGLPVNDHFYSLITSKITFDDAIYKDGNFHLLSACNGNMNMFNGTLDLGKYIVDIITTHEHEYDVILLDCPAGLSQDVCVLSAYCDYRFVVVTPDKSSITDSYSLIKVLSQHYGVHQHHLLFNMISDQKQYARMTQTFLSTVGEYLSCSVNVLGGVSRHTSNMDQFDRELLKVADSKIHNQFSKIVDDFVEKNINVVQDSFFAIGKEGKRQLNVEHEVRAY
jgi:flagellar biosynthesis protein FlhG